MKLDICSQRWTVKWDTEQLKYGNGKTYGMVVWDTNEIHIVRNACWAHTLMHEIVHIIDYYAVGDILSEPQTQAMATALLDCLKYNEALQEYIIGDTYEEVNNDNTVEFSVELDEEDSEDTVVDSGCGNRCCGGDYKGTVVGG